MEGFCDYNTDIRDPSNYTIFSFKFLKIVLGQNGSDTPQAMCNEIQRPLRFWKRLQNMHMGGAVSYGDRHEDKRANADMHIQRGRQIQGA
jgi:hypothetical protein